MAKKEPDSPGTEIATPKPQSDREAMKEKLLAMQPEWAKALPEHVNADRFTRVATTAIIGNPDLMAADRTSLFRACTQCAQDGLVPDGREAALVVFNTRDARNRDVWHKMVQYMPMVQGLLQLVYNTGVVSTFDVSEVKENDLFKFQRGDDPKIIHEPALRNRGNTIGAYAIVTLKDGNKRREWMDIDQILAVKERSRTKGEKGPWITDFDQMACKSVARRAIKYLPKSHGQHNEVLARALEADNATYDYTGRLADPEAPALEHEAPPKPKKQQASRMRGVVTGKATQPPEELPPESSVIDADFQESGQPAYAHDDPLGDIGVNDDPL